MQTINTNILFIIAPLMYALSIFVDVFTYHLKYNLHDGKNYRYLFSLINVFQYSARGFILVFVPIMAYYTESVKDETLIWLMILLAHLLVILLIFPLYHRKYSLFLSRFIITHLNRLLGKKEYKKDFVVNLNPITTIEKQWHKADVLFFMFSLGAFLIYGFSMTFLYYIAYYYPQRALTLSSYSQILNMFGAMCILLFLDPRMMVSIDNGKGLKELNILTTSRIVAHFIIIILMVIVWN